MEGGFPILNCLLQHTLRSVCSCSDSSKSSKWVYAVFWRILPRNYPPPKWDYGGSALDRSKGNRRNWILVWEDGFCDFYESEWARNGYTKGRFGADVFFKMSHEVYSYGEGLVGKVAAENTHKWVFRETRNDETDAVPISSWNVAVEPQPKAWEVQFNSGIQTIAIISVKEGIIQLGSFDKIMEDLNLVMSIQRKFSYLQSIPGVFAMQRPYLPIRHPYILKPNNTQFLESQVTGTKRSYLENSDDSPFKSLSFGHTDPQTGFPGLSFWSLPPFLPPSIPSCNNGIEATHQIRPMVDNGGLIREYHVGNRTMEASCELLLHGAREEQQCCAKGKNNSSNFEERAVKALGFGSFRDQNNGPRF